MSKSKHTISNCQYVVGYVRTSTELQADKVSPELQKKDIKEYCEQKGYVLVGFYEDVEKYRVGNRMVEPSSRRSDRPAWLKMLTDAKDGKFQGIIGWRSDRLYRGVNRALLALSELVKDHGINVELVKEHFDISYAPVIAWAAGIELEAKHDRLVMGMTGRFQKNKIWLATAPYGYDYIKENPEAERRGEETGRLVINEEESKWVQNIWEWYADSVTLREIRKRLIEGGAEQKGVTPRKHIWHIGVIQDILKYEPYYTGKFIITYDGERYEIDIPVIISAELALRVERRRKSYRIYPNGNSKYPTLLGGIVYCEACNVHMRVSSQFHKNKTGKVNTYIYYRCNNYSAGVPAPDCASSISLKKLETQVWEKVWNLFSNPDEFQKAVDNVLKDLNNSEVDAAADKIRIENRLLELDEERSWVISQGRRLKWSNAQLDKQLIPIESEENSLRKELQSVMLMLDGKKDKISKLANMYAEQIRIGYEFLTRKPKNADEEAKQFEIKKRLLRSFITAIDVTKDKEFSIYSEFNLDIPPEFYGIKHISASTNLSDPIKVEGTIFDKNDYRNVIALKI